MQWSNPQSARGGATAPIRSRQSTSSSAPRAGNAWPFLNIDGPKAKHFTVMPEIWTANIPELAYVRCHGRNAEGYIRSRSVPERFDYDYSMKELREIAGRVQRLAEHARAVHVLYIPTAFFAFAMSLATMTTRVRVARYKAVMFTPALASFLASAPSEPGLSSMLITSTSCSPAT